MGKISKLGISIGQIIRAEHLLRIINALSGEVPDTQIEVSGSVTASFFVGDGSQLTNLPTGSGGAPGGSNTEIQFNSGSVFSGSANFRYNYVSQSLQHGISVTAFGLYSHAEGSTTTASGPYSHTEGYNTEAIGEASHAEGENTIASGSSSHAEGASTQAIENYSHSEGFGTTTTGLYSHAEGYNTQTIGEASHAEGYNTQTIGEASHAEGNSTISSGSYSHAEGDNTQAIGAGSHAEGYYTIASGPYSHAEGKGTIAIGEHSHTEGLETIALGDIQHVIGQFNISSSAQSAFIIGNGTEDNNRSNLVFASGSQFQITGSLMVNDIIQLQRRTTTPTGVEGMIIVSGSAGSSKLYYYNGTTWNALF